MIMMDFKDMCVRAMYLGEFPVTGRIESSEVYFDGTGVTHIVALDQPVTVNGEVLARVRIEHKNMILGVRT